MRTTKALFLVLTMMLSTSLFASKLPNKAISKIISKEISKLLENPNFSIAEDMDVTVIMTINKKNEIVVLSVDSNNNEEVEYYIKSRLNYNRIFTVLPNKNYIVPVKLLRK